MTKQRQAASPYTPLYFLAALGAGGMAVTFFMYLMFWVPHPGQPVPIFEDVRAYWQGASFGGRAMVAVAIAGIGAFALLHIRLLLWNLRQWATFRRSAAHEALLQSNGETQIMALPLTLAMSINVGFILGLVFVPGLWSVVEYLFPAAMLAFVLVGWLALALLGRFLGRVLSKGGFDHAANTSFAQLLPAFALAMIGVGFAAPAAMSGTPWITTLALIASTFFMIAALVFAILALGLALASIMQHGTGAEAAPTLMVVIPILTILSIAWMRQSHGLHGALGHDGVAGETFVLLTRVISVQVLFLLLGLLVMARQGYSARFLSPSGVRSAGSYALVCPGVALIVIWQFWVNKGLMESGFVEKFSAAYWGATAPAIIAQLVVMWLIWRLHRLHFGQRPSDA